MLAIPASTTRATTGTRTACAPAPVSSAGWKRRTTLPRRRGWRYSRTASPGSEKKLEAWRRRVFNTLGIAILLVFVTMTTLVATGVVAILEGVLPQAPRLQLLWGLGIGSLASGFLAWLLMTWRLPRVFGARPR